MIKSLPSRTSDAEFNIKGFTVLKRFSCAKPSPPCSQLEYSNVPLLDGMVLEVTVKSKKTFVAATNIRLDDKMLEKETWFSLGNCAV